MWTIFWMLPNSEEKYYSPNTFDEEKAIKLCKVANAYFKRAKHYVEEVL